MRTQRVRTQTDASTATTDVSVKELADLAEFYGQGIATATHRTPLAGPLTPWSYNNVWLPTLVGEHLQLIREAGFEGFRDAAEHRQVTDLLVPEEMRNLRDSANTRRRFQNLWAAKLVVDYSDQFLVEVLQTVRGNEKEVSRKLGKSRSLFLSWSHLEAAMTEAVRPLSKEPTLTGEKPKHPLWVLACEAMDLGSNAWDQGLASALLETLATRWGMVACPQPQNVVLETLSQLCNRPRSEVLTALREYPSVYMLAFGKPVSSRTPRLWGSDPTPMKAGFDAYDEVRALHPEAFADSVPSHHATRKLVNGKAGRPYAILRNINAQFGDQVTDPKINKLYADTKGLRAAKGCTSPEAQMHTVLSSLYPDTRIVYDRSLENTTRMWRWDFRVEDPVDRMLVEVHGPDHFIEMRAKTAQARQQRLDRNREVDDSKTEIGLDWLDSHGGGTYLVVHHRVFDLVEADSGWLADILSALKAPSLPRWLYLRPVEGLGANEWPGFDNGDDGLDVSARRSRHFGPIEAVWVR